ncbi:MAG TPA: iron dependent repressor, metal binding and dimerization domain protein [Planctomycetota bacterium]|nr:iron dependent repressor, metal binding and dimerization domain protein [Planctomycetota bacterium]
MGDPLLNLLLFAFVVLVTGAVFWPTHGLLARLRRHRHLAGRILLEDALKHAYHQEKRGEPCTLATLGGALEIASQRAVALVTRMQEARFLRVDDGRILLTQEGTRYAVDVIRAHRLWERYLADETGVDALEWHARAEEQEHALTREQADELAARLGHPRYDPHGDPIPTAEGAMPAEEAERLAALGADDRAVVTHIEDEPHAVYAQLLEIGIYLGMEIRVLERTDEHLTCEADGKPFRIPPLAAGNVTIRRLEGAPTKDGTERLLALEPGEWAEVTRISPVCRGLERRRLMDLGLVPGTRIRFERRGLMGGLFAYRVRGAVIALREEQVQVIGIRRVPRAAEGAA